MLEPEVPPLIQLYVDADACPVKDAIYSVARRHGLEVHVVANSRMGCPGTRGST